MRHPRSIAAGPLVPALFGVCAASCLSRVRFSALRTSTLHFYRIRASSTRLVPIALNPLVPALFGVCAIRIEFDPARSAPLVPALFGVCAIIVAVLVSNRNLSSPHFSGYAPSVARTVAGAAASRPRTFRGMRHPMARNRLLSLHISHCRHRKTELLAPDPASVTSVFPHSEHPPFNFIGSGRAAHNLFPKLIRK